MPPPHPRRHQTTISFAALGLLLAPLVACSQSAILTRYDPPPRPDETAPDRPSEPRPRRLEPQQISKIEGEIIDSDANSIRLRLDGGEVTDIARDEVIDIDHPGNVAALLGTWGALNGAFMTVGGITSDDGLQRVIMLPAGIITTLGSLFPALWGYDTWLTSKEQAREDRHGLSRGLSLPDAHTHDGFLLRLQSASTSSSTTVEEGASSYELSGQGIAMSIDLGWSLTDHFALYTRLGLNVVVDASVEGRTQCSDSPNSTPCNPSKLPEPESFSSDGFGVGGSYFIMPHNISLDLAVLSTRTRVVWVQPDFLSSGVKSNTERGLGLRLGVTKEWWVSNDWGLGVALTGGIVSQGSSQRFDGSCAFDECDEFSGQWTTWDVGLAFSATYH